LRSHLQHIEILRSQLSDLGDIDIPIPAKCGITSGSFRQDLGEFEDDTDGIFVPLTKGTLTA
jgi:hypothetical protein